MCGFFFIYFILLYYAIWLSQFFPPSPLPPSTPNSFRPSPYLRACPWVMHISSLATSFPILYLTSPWLFCNYLFVLLNPLTSSPISPHPPPIRQPPKCSLYPWFCLSSCLLSLFFRFIVDRYIFIAILLFIVLFKDFIYLLLEKGEGSEEERERNIRV